MARPEKKNADYHTHDKDMRHDPKVLAVRRKFKHEGYAVYNMMLETLDDSDHFQYEWNQLSIELLSADFDSENFETIIAYCVKLGLFTVESGYIFSYQHQKRFKPLLSKRKLHSDRVSAPETPGNESEIQQKGVTDTGNPHSIVEYSRVEKSIVNNSTDSTIPKVQEVGTAAIAAMPATEKKSVKKNSTKKRELPDTVQQVSDYMIEKMKGKWAPARISTNADKLFNHYTANGWVQNKGKPIVSWKHAVNNWILNELNGAYASTNGSHVATHSGPSQTSQQPEEKKLSQEEKHQLSREFLQDCYQDYCNGGLPAGDDVLRFYFNDLIRDGLLMMSPEEKERIKKAANGDVNESKKIAVKEYFDKQKAEGVKMIYQVVT